MIAKEDIKKSLDGLAQFIIMNDTGTDESASAIEWHGIIKKALELAKKEHELLGLYQKRFSFYNFGEDKQLREIKTLEKELEEEMK